MISDTLHPEKAIFDLMNLRASYNRMPFDPRRDRFNLSFCADTRVHPGLNANLIVVKRHPIAIATQFPHSHQLEFQLQMIVANRTPVLVVLASDDDMQKAELPDYFSQSGVFGRVRTESVLKEILELGEGLNARHYDLHISTPQTSVNVPVLHVYNWPDHQSVPVNPTQSLVEQIEGITREHYHFYKERGSRAVDDPIRLLPVIHCRAGVGRTGQTIAALAIRRFPDMTLENMVLV